MDYGLFKREMRDVLKLDLNSYKEQQMHRRILQWVARYDLGTLSALAEKLKTDPEHRQKFLEYLTINTSHFFRDQSVFSFIETSVLPAIAGNHARIWSAGCSIGAEVYSIVMLLLEKKLPFSYIQATDIDDESLFKAKQGIYNYNQVNQVPPKYLEKYFSVVDGQYHLSEQIKQYVHFAKHNLLTDPYAGNFDLILCRNVFIYFTTDIQKQLIYRFVNSLKVDGFFIVGSAEHIINPSQYGLRRVSYCVYQKDKSAGVL